MDNNPNEVKMAFGQNVTNDSRVYRLTLWNGDVIHNVPEEYIKEKYDLENAADISGRIWCHSVDKV